MKLFRKILLLVALLICLWAVTATAEAATVASGSCGENVTYVLDDTGTLTISGTGAMKDFWNDVTWDSNKPAIKSVVIETGVTSIGKRAFQSCSSLTSVTIGDGVTSIGDYAFQHCSSLTSITIPNSVTSIGERAFYDCDSLTSVTIGNGATSIGKNAFYNCIGLNDVYVTDPNAWCKINFTSPNANPVCYSRRLHVLDSDGKEVTELVLDDSVTSIPAYAFKDFTSLTSITIPDSVTSIGENAFRNCDSLTSITIPDSVTSIGENAFRHCSNLTSVTIGNGVTGIGDGAFYECQSIKSVVIGNGVTSIGGNAFYGCTSLTSITIPDSVTSIGGAAFSACSSLSSVTIPDSVTSIGGFAFNNCSKMNSLTIGKSVCTIGGNAFEQCAGLTSVTIPDSVTYIGAYAFRSCIGLTSVVIGNGVETVGAYAFSGCADLTNLTIGNSVATIGENAFYNCKSITSLIIPNTTTYIGVRAFAGCTGLTKLTIGNEVKTIDTGAFRECSGLTSVTIPDSVNSIGQSAFNGCTSLSTLTIGKGVTYIGDWAFTDATLADLYITDPNAWCRINVVTNPIYYAKRVHVLDEDGNEISELVLDNAVSVIPDNAFAKCEKITSVVIPDTVTEIGRGAFSSSGVETVVIGKNILKIPEGAFFNCVNLKTVKFKGDAPSIYIESFSRTSATIYYPANNETWDISRYNNLSGDLTWVPYIPPEPENIVIPGIEGIYYSIQEAVEAYDPATQYIKLTGDVEVELTLTKDLKIDLNGFSLTGVIDLNGNTVYGVDNTTDGYSAANAGYFNCVDEKGDPVVPAAHFKTDKATYGAIKRYLAVQDENGWSFHRFYFGITHATLSTANGGVGYKAAFAGDEVVKAALGADGTYGIQLSLRADFDGCTSAAFSASEFPTDGKAQSRTLLLKNILAKGMALEEMTANATMPIYARTYLETADGTVIQSSVFQITLQQMVQSMDESFTTFAPAQQLHLKAFYATYADLFKDWELGNL